ncbi:hypothetical protein RHGRI_016145 [Rhododendron griersonianum]|uniref:BPL/LPL catalytic domain-containing protein n=1 Tax=Rhododendron griersonianum TaxID=479676 RepID=A0AAV6JPZ3_9ERIC|nr:hypothetical protein RHGRI_016145 [Rhododendron griersonianum]
MKTIKPVSLSYPTLSYGYRDLHNISAIFFRMNKVTRTGWMISLSMIVVPNLSLASIQTCPTGKDSQRLYKSRPYHVSLQCSRVSNFKSWEASSITFGQKRRCDCYDMHNVLVPYSEAWSWQKSIVKERKALVKINQDLSDLLIVLQHHPVYTLGTGSSEDYLNFDLKDAPYDVYRTERGGEVTYHGPGQVNYTSNLQAYAGIWYQLF